MTWTKEFVGIRLLYILALYGFKAWITFIIIIRNISVCPVKGLRHNIIALVIKRKNALCGIKLTESVIGPIVPVCLLTI